ncbi:MAG: hypothetical protein VKL39_12555 [Leptolyngbyaceae bacterium]|nr:hypothetical protein [Leptolyngbyaceae bacterium]
MVAIFWLMGVWPMIYACLMFLDGQMQNIPAWPFFIGSNFLGLLWLMPYFLFRQRSQTFDGKEDRWLTLLDRRSTGVVLLMVTLFLIFYALLTGDWEEFIYQFQHLTFVHLITLDFLLMGLVFPLTSLFPDDMARHGQWNLRRFWAIALVPLFGPLFYLCSRPPLQSNKN